MRSELEKNLRTIEELTVDLSISRPKIEYYISRGLLVISKRLARKRYLDYDNVKARLSLIEQWQNDGFTLDLIKNKLKEEGYPVR